MKKNGSKTNGLPSSQYRFPILKHRFLIAPLLCMCLFVCGVFAADTANYDTAWTFVFDGVKLANNVVNDDYFKDVKALPNGDVVCVGGSRDSLRTKNILLIKIAFSGNVLQKTLFRFRGGADGGAITVSKNGDYIIGGNRYLEPFVLRIDTLFNVKWSTWYYDSLQDKSRLQQGATINSILETSNGRIVCAAGDEYPNNNGYKMSNYAAYLEFDSLGTMTNWGEWEGEVGYEIGGFSIEETAAKRLLIAGRQAVFCIDTSGNTIWRKKYTFWLNKVGTETNNICRAKKLRDGSLMVAGQAYEGDCWTRYNGRLYYDAWWSPISVGGSNEAWDTAGLQGADDVLHNFTQLASGNLVFVGRKASMSSEGGAWTIVTDSTGKNILWEKQTKVPYMESNGKAAMPMAVCATPDSGFTIAGELPLAVSMGGTNAFAVHFVPKPVVSVVKRPAAGNVIRSVHCKVVGNKVVFTVERASDNPVGITIYNLAGKRVARLTSTSEKGRGAIEWDCKTVGKGIYYYRALLDGAVVNGKIGL